MNRGMSWQEAIKVYTRPRVIGMMFLGFAAGLPFPLVFTTLSTWLRDVGVDRTTIGFFAWVGITFSIKVFWAPVVDRAPLPGLTTHLGQRRGWMLLAQAGVMAGLVGMAFTDPTQHITGMALFALMVAFASATQDIAIDAYRIEAVQDEYQGAMAAMYQTGWRIAAALVGGAGALYIAEYISWNMAYIVMALSMLVGVATVFFIQEPEVNRTQRNFIDSVIGPFVEFFTRNSRVALWILVFIAIYRISDIVLANMAYPFYIDMGYSKVEIANIGKVFGVLMTILGAFVGGVLVVRFGILRILLLGAVLVTLTNLMFAMLAVSGKSLPGLTIVISSDNFSGGLAGAAFIAYLSSLTNRAYTATQYALFSSLMTLVPKFISGFSGKIVDSEGYIFFFSYAAILGIPAILMVLYFMRSKPFQAGHTD